MKNLIEEKNSSDLQAPGALSQHAPSTAIRLSKRWTTSIIFCAFLFVVCIALTLTPIIHISTSTFAIQIPLGSLLETLSSWFPPQIGPFSPSISSSLELLCLLTLTFLCSVCFAWLLWCRTASASQSLARNCIWLGAILAGAIYLVTPALLSNDTMVYAGYSRLLATYHANPYFVTLASFPHDPFSRIDDWAYTNALYGPIWIGLCGMLGLFLKPDPINYVIAFRLVALGAHLLNIWLVGRTLQTMGRSPRVVTLGMLLYAWSPLALVESSLSGHNDVFMVTFLLIGVLLAASAEHMDALSRLHGYLPPAVAFTLAALVKFTAFPVLGLYLLFLACRALRSDFTQSREEESIHLHWKQAAVVLCWSGGTACILTLALYGPFWIGHNLHAISGSFSNNRAATWAENSLMRMIIVWRQAHPAQQSNSLLVFLSGRQLWNDLTLLVLALCFLVSVPRLWREPTVSAFVSLTLLLMSFFLMITPWFYPWYLTWLIGMAAVSLPVLRGRLAAASFVLALTFSLSALSVYFNGILGPYRFLNPPITILLPLVAFLLCLGLYPSVQTRFTH